VDGADELAVEMISSELKDSVLALAPDKRRET
jgi:hypothetical protein